MISFLPENHWPCQVQAEIKVDPNAFLGERFNKSCSLFPAGRMALDWLFQHLHLCREDEVWVTTTFDLPNVSSCVTSTIFNHCKPSRVLSRATKAILVIHEFGVPHSQIEHFHCVSQELGIPLIEDCAHSLDSWLNNRLIGTWGDWTILSFPKVFPVREGGALLGKNIDYIPSNLDFSLIQHISDAIGCHLSFVSQYSALRRDVYQKMFDLATECGLKPLFRASEFITPFFFPFYTNDWQLSLKYALESGVDCARWHGSNIVVLPCHQFLTGEDLEIFKKLFLRVGKIF
ncbi:MAG: DegT/DnrJ/EryC1/StrS aminotransferase family protein [Deltaproteobacteria bacterium]|nr:DegT/DnrJ/EryC1/StrS aminotransferase family protein [Deltaproteobacteria bacterium]